jgi:hypothetical protein
MLSFQLRVLNDIRYRLIKVLYFLMCRLILVTRFLSFALYTFSGIFGKNTLKCGAAVALTTDWKTGVRSPTEAEDFSSSLCIQTDSGAHRASCVMGTWCPSPGVKRGRGVMLTTHPHLVPRLRMSRSYTSSPPKRHHGV